MIDETTDAPAQDADVKADIASAGQRLTEERQALSETIGGAREAVVAGAKDLGSQAADQLGAKAEGIKEEAAADLTAFSDALKAASQQLSGTQLGFAGDMVQQAAGGLETLARSLQDRSPADMLEVVRSFGRQNPVGFIAGSILAGFALGRVAATLPSQNTSPPPSGGTVATSWPSPEQGRMTDLPPAPAGSASWSGGME